MLTKKESAYARDCYRKNLITIRGEKFVYKDVEYDSNVLAVRARSKDINEGDDNEYGLYQTHS